MSSVRTAQRIRVGAVCCLVIVGCSDRTPTAAVNAENAVPPAAETQSSSQSPAGRAVQAIVQSSPELGWKLVDKTDEMTGTVARFALYRAEVDATTVEVEMTCPQQGGHGGLLKVTTHDGLLATALDDAFEHPSASARLDTGDGEIRSIALVTSDKFENVYFLANRVDLQVKNALGLETPIGTSRLELKGDPANFKLELELDNGMKRVVRGDSTLAQYLEPCTSSARDLRQQQQAEEQQQRQDTETQRQKAELDQWSQAQSGAADISNSTPAPAESEIERQ